MAREKPASTMDLSNMVNRAPMFDAYGRPIAQNFNQGFFGPGQPPSPVLNKKDADKFGAWGRRYDYMMGQNLWVGIQRDTSGVSFAQLRQLSRTWGILRLIIESRKDKVIKLRWTVHSKDPEEAKKAKKKGATEDPRIKEIRQVLKRPDGVTPFRTWLRQVLEDKYVIDAIVIRPKMTYGGDVVALDLIDGATIKMCVGADGRIPLAPNGEEKEMLSALAQQFGESSPQYTQELRKYTAYQQILKGNVAADFMANELLYAESNPSTDRLYGYSIVEQIITVINMAIRRELSQLAYFTDGNMPDYFITAAEDWTPSEIEQYQAIWDAFFEGDVSARRHGKVIPYGMAPKEVKEPPLKTEFDEWMIRYACYAFSESPQPFLRMMNRATAETAKDAAQEEGVQQDCEWLSGFVTDEIIEGVFGYDDLEFLLENSPNVDAKVEAETAAIYIASGVWSPDFVAARTGVDDGGTRILINGASAVKLEDVLNPPKPDQELQVGMVPSHLNNFNNQKPNDKEGQKPEESEPKPDGFQKGTLKYKVLSGLSRNRKATRQARTKMAKILRGAFGKTRPAITKQVIAAYKALPWDQIGALKEALSKTAEDPFETFIEQILGNLTFEEFVKTYPAVASALEELIKDSTEQALIQVHLQENAVMMDLVNTEAVAWTEARAAEMVGMRLVGGELVTNPIPKWAITDGTREYLRSTIQQAIKEGWSTQQLAEAIEENLAFSDYRAETIARTEIANADIQGNLIAYRNSGVVVGLKWLLALDPCDRCITNSVSGPHNDGIIPINGSWPYGPPTVHPRCECDIAPVVAEDFDETGEGVA